MAKKRSVLERVPLAPVFAVLFGTAAAILVGATPQWLFEQAVAATGLGSVVSVAAPPLGVKARLLAMVVAFGGAAFAVWFGARLIERAVSGPRARTVHEDDDVTDFVTPEEDDALDLGAYVIPEESPRRPIFADRELGAPLMSDAALATASVAPVTVEPDPVDAAEPFAWPEAEAPATMLDGVPVPAPVTLQPFTWPDPVPPPAPVAEVVPEPFEWPEPVVTEVASPLPEPEPEPEPETAAELAAPLSATEFDLPPVTPEEPEQLPGESSIDALIRRLEAGLARRGPPLPPSPGPAAIGHPGAGGRPSMFDAGRDAHDDDTARALHTLRRMAG